MAQATGKTVPAAVGPVRRMSLLYLLEFFSLGALFPLWPLYYQGLGLPGWAIGLLLSVMPVAGILMPPIWGLLADRRGLHKAVLLVATLGAGGAALLAGASQVVAALFASAALLATLQSAWTPISDSLALNIAAAGQTSFGAMRLWGSIGFAAATLTAGTASDRFGLGVIFPLFAAGTLLAATLVPGLPAANSGVRPATPEESGNPRAWRRLLSQPAFLYLMLGTFAVTGGLASNNYYFGLLYQGAGGSLRGVGVAFLLFAASEVPAMLAARRLAQAIGAARLLLVAAAIAGLRWVLYSLPLAPWQLLATFPLQGLSTGLILAVSPSLVAQLTPKGLEVTALALNGVAGFGLGAIFTSSLGGWLLDAHGVRSIYAFFAALNLAGLAALAMVARLASQRRET